MFGLKGESWNLCPTEGVKTRDGELISNPVIHLSRPDEEWESGIESKSVEK